LHDYVTVHSAISTKDFPKNIRYAAGNDLGISKDLDSFFIIKIILT